MRVTMQDNELLQNCKLACWFSCVRGPRLEGRVQERKVFQFTTVSQRLPVLSQFPLERTGRSNSCRQTSVAVWPDSGTILAVRML
jgi:hypothetical protein